MQEEHLKTWQHLKTRVAELKEQAHASIRASAGANHSDLLFRGQGSSEWKLETTYDRTNPKQRWLSDYYHIVAAAMATADSLVLSDFGAIDTNDVSKALQTEDKFFPIPLPHYDLLAFLRHHGFPSPLLDWSRSFYVAAYFAFEQPQADPAIYVYQEFTGVPKTFLDGEAHLVTFGPWVKTHPRHVMQQALYTMAVQRDMDYWRIAHHEDVFTLGSESQDRLKKLTIPKSEARRALEELDEMNINAYSLFQTDDALFRTLGMRLLK